MMEIPTYVDNGTSGSQMEMGITGIARIVAACLSYPEEVKDHRRVSGVGCVVYGCVYACWFIDGPYM